MRALADKWWKWSGNVGWIVRASFRTKFTTEARRCGAAIGHRWTRINANIEPRRHDGDDEGSRAEAQRRGEGRPTFRRMDCNELPRLIPGFQRVGPSCAHGLLLFRKDSFDVRAWLPGSSESVPVDRLTIVGQPIKILSLTMSGEKYSRQSFLGADGQAAIERVTIGIAGLGGGGSHIAQPCAHVGFSKFRLFDADGADESNLNRLVTATENDAVRGTLKIDLARRRLLGIQSNADVQGFPCRWQDRPEVLRECDLVFGSVDSFAERRELEAICRRYVIPLVDIGMDLHQAGDEAPVMGGQVILSIPGGPCMFCLGYLTEVKLGREALKYGAAGGRPQVVWANGVLASTAVGIAVDLLTNWTRAGGHTIYLSYRGNDGTLVAHPRLNYLKNGQCPHYPPDEVGDPVFKKL